MRNKIIKWLDPILVMGLLISITISVVMVLIGQDKLSGLQIGLLVAILTFLIDNVARIQKSESVILASNHGIVDEFEKDVDRIIVSLKGTNIRRFANREEEYSYLAQRIKRAKKYLDITHFSPSIPQDYSTSDKYLDVLDELIRQKRINVRRIMMVSTPEQIKWIRQLIKQYSGLPFFLGCFPKPDYFMPAMNLFVIDGEEVLIAGGERKPSLPTNAVLVNHKVFVDMAQDHFDALWRASIKLNEKKGQEKFLKSLEDSIKG